MFRLGHVPLCTDVPSVGMTGHADGTKNLEKLEKWDSVEYEVLSEDLIWGQHMILLILIHKPILHTHNKQTRIDDAYTKEKKQDIDKTIVKWKWNYFHKIPANTT